MLAGGIFVDGRTVAEVRIGYLVRLLGFVSSFGLRLGKEPPCRQDDEGIVSVITCGTLIIARSE